MRRSLLIASFAVLTASVFGMNPGYHGESSGGSNNQPLGELRFTIPPYNDLQSAYNQSLRMHEEKDKLIANQVNIIAAFNQRLHDLESSVQTLQKENENWESLFREKTNEVGDLKDKIEKEILAKKMNAEKVEELQKQIKKVRGEKEELRSSLQEKDKKIEELTEQHEMDSLSLGVNKEEVGKLTEYLGHLREEKEELEKQLEESRNNEAELTEEIERLNQKIERSREKRRKIREEKNSEINELMEQVADLEQQLKQIKRNEQKVQQENEKLKEKINQTNQRLEQTKAKNSAKKSTSQDKFTYIRPIRNHKVYKCNAALYRQSHYDTSNGVSTGGETPTTILVKSNGKPKNWESILEIRYANDVLHNEVRNPKVIFYRSDDSNCYIILRIDGNNHGIVYGLNERCTEVGKNYFSVYEVSGDVGSFTDNVSRLIYVDNSGLYIVSAEENPVNQVSATYKEEGQFNFKEAVIKVSAADGSITWNGEPITKDNFFDNWVKEAREVQKVVFKDGERTIMEKETEPWQVLSTKQPSEKEVFRNFYPPYGSYLGIMGWLNVFTEREGRNWLNFFVRKRLQFTKEMNVQRCEKLIKNGTVAKILHLYISNLNPILDKRIRDIIVNQLQKNNMPKPWIDFDYYSPDNIVSPFRNTEFVKSLKPEFAAIEKDYERNKESDIWFLFEIIRSL